MNTLLVRVRLDLELLLLVMLLVGCDSQWGNQVSIMKYSNLSEAVSANAVAKGWIPDFLPKSATNIIVWHNVEINRMRVEFSFDTESDGPWFETLFDPVTDSRSDLLKFELLRTRGATVHLRGDLHFFELSKHPAEQGYLAINHDQSRAQYWTRLK